MVWEGLSRKADPYPDHGSFSATDFVFGPEMVFTPDLAFHEIDGLRTVRLEDYDKVEFYNKGQLSGTIYPRQHQS